MNLKQKLSKKQSKITEHFTQSKIYIKTFCIYKIYLISAKGYENAGVDFLRVKRNGEVWTKMRNVQDGLRVQNIYDLVSIEIYGIYKTKNLTKEKIKKYKMTERKIIEKYDDLSENELNAKTTKMFVPKLILCLLLWNAAEAKTLMLMIPDSHQNEVKSKIGNIFINGLMCEKYTDNVSPRKLIMMTNLKIKQISRCADCLASKTFVDITKH